MRQFTEEQKNKLEFNKTLKDAPSHYKSRQMQTKTTITTPTTL